MSGVTKKLMSASGGVAGFTAIEDVFSTYLYTGNSSTQTITNGIDLAGEGGLVWMKVRGSNPYTTNHILVDSERDGYSKVLHTNSTEAQKDVSNFVVEGVQSDGFTLGYYGWTNNTGDNYASWTFRKAPRFFDVVTYTGTGASQNIPHELGVVPGCVIFKRTDSATDWLVWHKNVNGTNADGSIKLNSTAAKQNGQPWDWDGVTDTYFPIISDWTEVNASGGTYVAYLFAHDPLGPSGDGSDGLIDCGSYTGNGLADGPEIDLGWEPQWVMIKKANAGGTPWHLFDNMRGMDHAERVQIYPNTSEAEFRTTAQAGCIATATGFTFGSSNSGYNSNLDTFIYIAIRRGPMRAPTSGTEVFDVALGTGTYTHTTGFPVDFAIQATRASTIIHRPYDRLRGGGLYLETSDTGSDQGGGTASFDNSTGYTNFGGTLNAVDWMFRRAPEFFDVVAYTGTGTIQNISHNLGAVPEMMIVKSRNNASGDWHVYHKDVGALSILQLNKTDAKFGNGSAFWGSTAPTSSVFTVGVNTDINNAGENDIAYLFSTLAGISKVGSYTGNGSNQTINCGFTSGARLVLIKATSTTGDWLIADTARGIVAGNDPYLELNTTNAEVTSEDWLDPDSSGFIVNEVAGSNANTSGVSYIFYAVA